MSTAESDLKNTLTRWFQSLVAAAPSDDPRRTPECLSIPEAVELAAQDDTSTSERWQHIRGCVWCQRALQHAGAARGCQRSGGTPARISDADLRWPEELQQRLRVWVAESAAGETGDRAACFDSDGTLHLDWQGIEEDGPVSVSLLWADTPLPLAECTVRHGRLSLSRPLPHLGLREVTLPASLLRLQREAAPQPASDSAQITDHTRSEPATSLNHKEAKQ